jgi:hypothetical protein
MKTIPYFVSGPDGRHPYWIRLAFILLVSLAPAALLAGEHLIIQLKDFDQTELKAGGFTLPNDAHIHIRGLGAGDEKHSKKSGADLFAYGWIIDANTRALVWKMDRDNTSRENEDRRFDAQVPLRKGSYEVYFTAYAFSPHSAFFNMTVNIDRRKDTPSLDKDKKRGFFTWFHELLGGDFDKEWKKRSKTWGVELYASDGGPEVTMFNPPVEFPRILFRATRMGEDEHIRQDFSLSKPVSLRIYALGEMQQGNDPVDFGWIVESGTHKRIWDMEQSNLLEGGGDEKNVKFDGTVSLPAGDFTLYYNTDDSHSYVDWNAAPPEDPLNYGVTLIALSDADKAVFKLTEPKKERNVIVQLTKVGNDERRSASFTLNAPAEVRVYALGERGGSSRQMADYGWIINANTREKVWTMDVDETEHAGGGEKNRMIDQVIKLPKGTYTVYYQSDDSHAYNEWNAPPPFDPEHWGITVSGEGEDFSMHNVETNVSPKQAGVISQIIRVEDNASLTEPFRLDKPTHVRVYAIGEGQNNEMNDYGYIEDGRTGKIIWEMTYSMTFHAGGGRKNRMVNTTILLDKGEYKLHYVSDDSHSYDHWNTDPPDDPTMWGITLYKEQ